MPARKPLAPTVTPIDPMALARAAGLTIRIVPDAEAADLTLLPEIRSKWDKRLSAVIPHAETSTRGRFVIAQAIGHLEMNLARLTGPHECFIWREAPATGRKTGGLTAFEDRLAQTYAVKLLMPEEVLRQAALAVVPEVRVETVASLFKVGRSAARLRLMQLVLLDVPANTNASAVAQTA